MFSQFHQVFFRFQHISGDLDEIEWTAAVVLQQVGPCLLQFHLGHEIIGSQMFGLGLHLFYEIFQQSRGHFFMLIIVGVHALPEKNPVFKSQFRLPIRRK
jgi:hypothetical protein